MLLKAIEHGNVAEPGENVFVGIPLADGLHIAVGINGDHVGHDDLCTDLSCFFDGGFVIIRKGTFGDAGGVVAARMLGNRAPIVIAVVSAEFKENNRAFRAFVQRAFQDVHTAHDGCAHAASILYLVSQGAEAFKLIALAELMSAHLIGIRDAS